MQNDLGHHASQEEDEQAHGELEAGPVVPVLEDLKSIALEVNLASKVLLVEGVHGNLVLAIVLVLVLLVIELDVVLDGLAGVARLFVLTRAKGGCHGPKGHENGNGTQDDEEEPCLQTTTDLEGEVEGNTSEQSKEDVVVEAVAAWAIGGQGSVLDGRVL